MKKFVCIGVLFALVFALCGCSSTGDATLTFTCYEYDIVETLTQEEAQEVARIFDNKKLSIDFFGTPSCGFSKEVSIRVGGRTYWIAQDSCEKVQCGLFFYTIPEEDMAYIHALFEKYGGDFPGV